MPQRAAMTPEHGARLDTLADLIATSPHNLVSSAERARVRTEHIPECWALGDTLAGLGISSGRWLDLGTGGGLPGLVLAMRLPAVQWVLVDASAKKIDQVRAFADTLGLDNVRCHAGRAEVLARAEGWRAAFDGVIARALAPLRVLAELARGFVAAQGWLAAVKGPGWEHELAAAERAMARCGWAEAHVHAVTSPVRSTWLVTMRAVGAPPQTVPRRDGVPHRRPL